MSATLFIENPPTVLEVFVHQDTHDNQFACKQCGILARVPIQPCLLCSPAHICVGKVTARSCCVLDNRILLCQYTQLQSKSSEFGEELFSLFTVTLVYTL